MKSESSPAARAKLMLRYLAGELALDDPLEHAAAHKVIDYHLFTMEQWLGGVCLIFVQDWNFGHFEDEKVLVGRTPFRRERYRLASGAAPCKMLPRCPKDYAVVFVLQQVGG